MRKTFSVTVLGFLIVCLLTSATAFCDQEVAETTQNNPPFEGTSNASNTAIRIGIIDSGIDYNHPKLKKFIAGTGKQNQLDGWDFRDSDALPYDYEPPIHSSEKPNCSWVNQTGMIDFDCVLQSALFGSSYLIQILTADTPGHGTHVAGIAQKISKTALIVPYRVSFRDANIHQQIISAIELAHQQGVRVINMSFCFLQKPEDPKFQKVLEVKKVMEKYDDILFVAAAGNENTDMIEEKNPAYPAAFKLKNLIAVGAVDWNGKLADFSNIGKGLVDVYAPGVNITSTWPGGNTQVASGTSMASPYVAGLAARILALWPNLTAAELKTALLKYAVRMPLRFKKKDTGKTHIFAAKVIGPNSAYKK